MNTKTIFLMLGAGVILIGGAVYVGYQYQQPIESPQAQQEEENIPQAKEEQELTANGITVTPVIAYTDQGYAPKTYTIKAGDTVTFVNHSSTPTWSATALHPSHTLYPGSSFSKCGTDQEPGIFDACRGIEANGEWTFTFQEKGTWNYHDHLSPTRFGTIIVE